MFVDVDVYVYIWFKGSFTFSNGKCEGFFKHGLSVKDKIDSLSIEVNK
jgi:hypothetical protein